MTEPSADLAFLSGGGEMGALIRAHDWPASRLGPAETWPQPLRTALRLVLNTGHPMYIWWGPDLVCFYNDAYRASIGPERHPGSLGRPGREVWAEIWPIIGPQIDQVLEGRGAVWRENQLVPITRNGHLEDVWWTYSYSPIDDPDAPSGVGGVLVVTSETTSTVLAERRATSERHQLWSLSEDMLARADYDGQMSAVNPAWTKVLGWSEEELLTNPYADIINPEDVAQTVDALRSMGETGLPTRFENRILCKDGAWKPIGWTVSPEADGVNFIAIGRDLADYEARERDLLRTQEALRQSQKMEAVGQLTGGVAHDFNNLLTVIRSSADLLRRRDLPEDRRRRYVDAISDTADRAAKLTSQLLTFSRRQALLAQVFEVSQRVGSIAEMLRTLVGARILLDIDVRCAECFIEADAGQFETALINMAVNARDAMNGEGRLTFTVDAVDGLPGLRGHAPSPGAFVTVSVTDSGQGITAADMVRVFEPFFTTKGVGQGTGLGLSQVYGFAKQSGGDVAVQSEVGRGSTFTLYLPRSEAVSPSLEPSPPAPRGKTGGRILVVEDNLAVGEFAAQLLNDLGYETQFAANATEAMAILERDVSAFDVVFSDVVMPGISGVEMAQRIRERWPDLPIVLASGYSHVLAQDAHHGFPVLHKPYSVEGLSQILRAAAAR